MLSLIAFVALLLPGLALVAGAVVHRCDLTATERAWAALEQAQDAAPRRYDPQMVAALPPVAQRYFARAIAPGTPLRRSVTLEMAGGFTLKDAPLPMQARQILCPPDRGFVWKARIGSGLLRFAGSDGYLSQGDKVTSWTRFWLSGVLPLARIGGGPDHARAAASRAMMESVWVPAALLPQFGATWLQTGPDRAEIRFGATPDLPPMQITLDTNGDLTEVHTLRWSDANPDKTYRLQPFGGRMFETAVFQGFRIPVRVALGNHWGTPDYAPFFHATIIHAEY